ncbi:methylenetetrahydrofolate reductase [Streptomyces sp. NPDC002156]
MTEKFDVAPRRVGGPPVRSAGVAGSRRAGLARALREATYEVLPFRATEEKVLAHVSKDVALTVTTTETKGLGPTLDLAVRLRRHGYRVAPHLAARLVRDEAQLADIVAQLSEADVDAVFVVAGDAAEPTGDFPDALSLLEGLKDLGHRFSTVGIGGYPEGHAKIAPDAMSRALDAKSPHATQIITQLCFDPSTTLEWARAVRAHGVDLPIRVGIPGAVNRQKLIRISSTLGLGQSARFLRKQRSMLWRFFLPGGYSPNRLVQSLSSAFGQADNGLDGLHVFTFNELAETESWRQNWLARLS